MPIRHFLTLMDLSAEELKQIIERAIELKKLRNQGIMTELFRGKVLGMIFENPPPAPVFPSKPAWRKWAVAPSFCHRATHSWDVVNRLRIARG